MPDWPFVAQPSVSPPSPGRSLRGLGSKRRGRFGNQITGCEGLLTFIPGVCLYILSNEMRLQLVLYSEGLNPHNLYPVKMDAATHSDTPERRTKTDYRFN